MENLPPNANLHDFVDLWCRYCKLKPVAIPASLWVSKPIFCSNKCRIRDRAWYYAIVAVTSAMLFLQFMVLDHRSAAGTRWMIILFAVMLLTGAFAMQAFRIKVVRKA